MEIVKSQENFIKLLKYLTSNWGWITKDDYYSIIIDIGATLEDNEFYFCQELNFTKSFDLCVVYYK